MKTFIFSTNNKHKLQEVSAILKGICSISGLSEVGINTDIPETGTTLEENALIKARYIWELKHIDCFADDTGLEVEVLHNAPGVYSARYAGDAHDSIANMKKLLENMKEVSNRKARFRTVIAAIIGGIEYQFEGIINGTITEIPKGDNGFGYDPIFIPEGYNKTFAELGDEIKNKISHRAIAVEKLKKFLLSK